MKLNSADVAVGRVWGREEGGGGRTLALIADFSWQIVEFKLMPSEAASSSIWESGAVAEGYDEAKGGGGGSHD